MSHFLQDTLKVCRDVLYVVKDESSNLRYKRLTHISNKGFQILAKKSLIPFSKGKTLNPGYHCLFDKQHKVSFAISSQKKSNYLELVYFDVCGPIEVEYLGANRYFVTSIDDASRKLWAIC